MKCRSSLQFVSKIDIVRKKKKKMRISCLKCGQELQKKSSFFAADVQKKSAKEKKSAHPVNEDVVAEAANNKKKKKKKRGKKDPNQGLLIPSLNTKNRPQPTKLDKNKLLKIMNNAEKSKKDNKLSLFLE